MNNRQTTQKCVAVVVNVALAFACSVRGADVTWSNTSGGIFEVGGNWVGGSAPGTNDAAKFSADASYTVTFGGTVTNGHAYFYAPGGTVTLDIGAGNQYYLSDVSSLGTLRLQNTAGGAASAAIVSGAMSVRSHIYVGDLSTYNGNKLTVAHTGTYLETRAYDVNIGLSGSFNEMLITNGATVSAYRTAYAGYNTGSNNLITVTGAGSLLVPLNGNVVVGRYGDNNRIVVGDGGSVTAPKGALIVGDLTGADSNAAEFRAGANGVFSNGSCYVGNNACNGNSLTLSNATYYGHFNLIVGNSGVSNTMEMAGGADVTDRTHLYIGNTASAQDNAVVIRDTGTVFRTTAYDLNVGNYGSYNTLTLANGGQAEAYRSIYVGTTGPSSYNLLVVNGSNSVLRSLGLTATYSIAVGVSGTNNVLLLENGGAFVCSNAVEFSVGVNASAQSNLVMIGSGCFVTNGGQVYVGKNGGNNALTVSNSVFCVGGYTYAGFSGSGNTLTVQDGAEYLESSHFYIGYNAEAVSNTITVTGSGTTMNNTKFDLDVGRGGSFNLLDISKGASVEIMRNAFVGHLNTASNNTLRVAAGSFRCVQPGEGNVIVSNACTLAIYGSNSVVRARTLRVEGGSALDFRVDGDGFTPLEVLGTARVDDTTRLTVDASAFAKAGGGTVTLMTYGSMVGTIPAENITLLPEGSTVNQRDGNSMTLRVPSNRGTLVRVL